MADDCTDPLALRCWDLLQTLRDVMHEDTEDNTYARTFLALGLTELMSKILYETEGTRETIVTWLLTVFVPEVLDKHDVLQAQAPPPRAGEEGG